MDSNTCERIKFPKDERFLDEQETEDTLCLNKLKKILY